MLADQLGYTAVHLHYNSGRHISINGREFAKQLETLLREWPVPVEELTILGHSLGGLLARSACHYGAQAGHGWLQSLKNIVFLGTPHHGAPLERGGNWLQVSVARSPAAIISRASSSVGIPHTGNKGSSPVPASCFTR